MSTWTCAAQVPSSALRFYRRHAAWVVGISLVPGAQRFVSTLVEPAAGVQGLLETITAAARLVLLGLIAYAAFRAGRRGCPWRFVRERWPSLAVQAGMLAALIAACSIGIELGVPAAVPALRTPLYTAIVLLVKNPTVIAFVFVWIVLAVRQVIQYRPDERALVQEARHASR